jgi:hypothetical protein|tara:strand:+ start:5864 stop:6703 length:840 start_codon:yes stop_codon:yes gene_type:complete
MKTFEDNYEDTFKANLGSDVSNKNGFNYMSWSNVWKHLKMQYPDAEYNPKFFNDMPFLETPLGYYVATELKLTKDSEVKTYMHPVLNYSNKAELKPTVMTINTSIKRCLVKQIAIETGLGLSMYSNEDLPPDEIKKADKDKIIEKILNSKTQEILDEEKATLEKYFDKKKIDINGFSWFTEAYEKRLSDFEDIWTADNKKQPEKKEGIESDVLNSFDLANSLKELNIAHGKHSKNYPAFVKGDWYRNKYKEAKKLLDEQDEEDNQTIQAAKDAGVLINN